MQSDDALDNRRHAENIRRLLDGVRGQAKTAGLKLAEKYETRADELAGQPLDATHRATDDQVGALISVERKLIASLGLEETRLLSQIALVRKRRLVSDVRFEAIRQTLQLLEPLEIPRTTLKPLKLLPA